MLQLNRQNSMFRHNTSATRWCYAFFIFFFSLCYSSYSLAKPVPAPKKSTAVAVPVQRPANFIEYLTQEKNHLTAAIKEGKQHLQPKDEKEYQAKLGQVSSILKMTATKIENLNGFLEQQNIEQNTLNQRLKHLQQLPIVKEGITIEERVAKVEALLTINKQATQLINDNLALAKEFHEVLTEEGKHLQFWHANFVLEQKLLQIKAIKDKLNQDLNKLYQSDLAKTNGKKAIALSANDADYETRLLVNNQNIAAIQYELNALSAQKTVVRADMIYLKNPDSKNLQLVTDIYKDAVSQYNKIAKSLQQISVFLSSEADAIKTPDLKQKVKTLVNTLTLRLNDIGFQKQEALKKQADYQAQLKQLISSRQTLAEYNINSWPIIVKKIAAIPSLFYKYIKTLSLKVYDSYLWLTPLAQAIFWGGLGLIASLFFMLNRFLKMLRSDKERSRLAGYLLDGFLVLVQRNIPYLCLTAMLMMVFYVTHISFSNYQLVLKLIAVWFTFRIAILIPRLALLETLSDSSGKDVKLYYRLKWLLLFGGWTTALMTIGHLLPLSLLLQDIFNRLFMLFLLAVSVVAWKSREVVRYLIHPLLTNKKRYVLNAISLLIILVPITVFSTAVIGLSGFINLAWTMSQYQANALTVLVTYIIARGLLFDALELFSEWMISSLRNGWLWIEVFLKPIDSILRIGMLFFSFSMLCNLFGWNSDSWVIVSLERLVQSSIVNVPGIHITVASTLAFLILLAIFFWAAKWTREFCYRWLFKNTKDVGIRNSLSVFSQYSVVLIGGFVTLHVWGFDFSGMSMIIGGLAVGMGFGLRDFASNIVGGLMLLIERPVREGDLITIGEYEGQVKHIGIRCMRVSSWDNMEILIPNAETFNKPFTNWTHQDGIVRSVVPIKVSRADDPVMIQQLILDVLAIIPEIVPDPPAQVFLKKIDEALIEFEARYYVNVQLHSRFEVRSNVLFAITAQFKAANVRPPVEPLAIEIKEGYGQLVAKD
ncbi:mechanosensitive ion channel domain-containing protein [Legionella rowbothamii]|uniref:mechanosensitive ion channel domain-containing protein n=1 Tax=Legionella rowbothamii TaxID=96229 RepID=UPI001F5E5731|nr:mechanosensitive ion channel domain-containing protein [Legionella rowbothamii]